MNRLLSILVTLFILFLVYLWINHLMGNSQGTPYSSDSIDTTTEQSAEEYDMQDEEAALEDHQETSDETVGQEAQPAPNPPAREEPKADPVKAVGEAQDKKQDSPSEVPPSATKASDKEGAHLVIAGNFLERANAEERVRELKKLGYSKAEVVNFELSEYHTACAGRYTDLNEARRVAKKIKDQHNIDTYVRHGN